MEQDKQLKQILLNSAEGASAGFTEAVMQKNKCLISGSIILSTPRES